MRLNLLFLGVVLAVCNTANANFLQTKDAHLDSLNDINSKLEFLCVHEKIPAASADTDVLFEYARWLQKNNQLKQDKAVDAEMERLYRIAAENQHYKANINLQNGTARGQFKLSGEEVLRLSQQLIDANVATGYYLIATYLQRGVAGLQQDTNMAMRYYRKAADEGNSQAQGYVADKLESANTALDVVRKMRWCAAEQGNGDAAVSLAVDLKMTENYQEALQALQLGVAAGSESAPSFLGKSFLGPKPDDTLYYMAQKQDPVRAERYKKNLEPLGRLVLRQPRRTRN